MTAHFDTDVAVRAPSVQKDLVKAILTSPHELEWQVQGLGMLRTYLSEERRLHIWDERLKFEGASEMHTHPWNFRSYVVAGVVHNFKYCHSGNALGEEYNRQKIHCGVGGGLVGEPEKVHLISLPPERYVENETYKELAEEIHISIPADGTVTIVKREFLDDVDHAYVFWKEGAWGTAEPREATKNEITNVCGYALQTWF